MEKRISVGIFWAVSDKNEEQRLLKFAEACDVSEADCNGFINYPYSHYEV